MAPCYVLDKLMHNGAWMWTIQQKSQFYIPYTRHYNPLLIWNRSWIQTIHKDRIFWKNLLEKRFWLSKSGYKIYKPRVMMARVQYIINIIVKALAGSQGIVNFVNNEGLGFLKLANIVLILINPSPCYVKRGYFQAS